MRKFVSMSKVENADDDDNLEQVTLADFNHTDAVRILEAEVIDESSFQQQFEVLRSKAHRVTFDSEDLHDLKRMFKSYCNMKGITKISPSGKSALVVAFGNQVYACNRYRGSSPYSYVIARWHSKENKKEFRPAVIQDLFEIEASGDHTKMKKFWVARLKWFKEVEPASDKFHYGNNAHLTLWDTQYITPDKNTYIPVRFIKSRFVYRHEEMKLKEGRKTVTIAIELPFQSFL